MNKKTEYKIEKELRVKENGVWEEEQREEKKASSSNQKIKEHNVPHGLVYMTYINTQVEPDGPVSMRLPFCANRIFQRKRLREGGG